MFIIMNDIKKIIGERIKAIRNSKNIKQETLAELSNNDTRTISSIENGHSLSITTLESIIKALDISVADFFELNIVDKTDEEMIEDITKTLPTLSSKDLKTYYKILKSLN